jgi:hypothetical protein
VRNHPQLEANARELSRFFNQGETAIDVKVLTITVNISGGRASSYSLLPLTYSTS